MGWFSSLGNLFDPVGALATGGNNSNFDSVFNPAQDLLGSSGLDAEPSWLNSFNNSYTTPVDNFADNVMDVNTDELKNLGNHAASNPWQLLTGVDPASTKLWNAATDQNNSPWVDQFGGETNADTQATANRGINTEDAGYVSSLAHMIAGYEAGGALGNLGSSAYSSAVGGAGDGAAGSSSLDVQAELADPSTAGTGGSSVPWDAKSIPGYATGGAGATAAGQATKGASLGAANSLDNNTNPFQGAAYGATTGLVGSKLDYAGAAGIDDPLYKGAINGAVTGGLKTAMSDPSDTGYGALVGALGNLGGQGMNAVSNMFSNSPTGSSGMGGNGMQSQSTGNASGGSDWSSLAAGLGNLYLAHRNASGINSQINNLNGLYSPNSAYAQQMQSSLDRQDAASGRRSQYGTRAVELQAALANAASRNAGTLSNLYSQQRSNNFNQLAGLFTMGKNAGVFGGSAGYSPTMDNSYTPLSQASTSLSSISPASMNQGMTDSLPGYQDPYGGQ